MTNEKILDLMWEAYIKLAEIHELDQPFYKEQFNKWIAEKHPELLYNSGSFVHKGITVEWIGGPASPNSEIIDKLEKLGVFTPDIPGDLIKRP